MTLHPSSSSLTLPPLGWTVWLQAATGDPGKTWPSFSSSSGGGGGGSGGRDGGGTESIMLLDVASHGGVRAAPNFRATLCDIWDGVAVAQTPIE